MPTDPIADSWQANAEAWIAAVRGQRIESRRLATDTAIVDAVVERRPRRVLDVGCGEGWLCRALQAQGITTVGIDVSPALIAAARHSGPGEFRVVDYAELVDAPIAGRFDLAICNFALLGEAVTPLLASLRGRLETGGRLLIQTVHPWTAAGDAGYADGWRVEDFAAFGDAFPASMPWYFRTLESWIVVCRDAGFSIAASREPRHPQSGLPLSLLLSLEPRSDAHQT